MVQGSSDWGGKKKDGGWENLLALDALCGAKIW